MKLRIVIILLGIACLGGYLTVVYSTSDPFSPVHSNPGTSALPPAVAALAGAWEGFGPQDLPAYLVVENVRERWATVHYTWSTHPEGKSQEGWVRVRAVVFPDGKLYWRHPGDFKFQLSEDWTTLVGTREQRGQTATSLLRRMPEGTALHVPRVEKDS